MFGIQPEYKQSEVYESELVIDVEPQDFAIGKKRSSYARETAIIAFNQGIPQKYFHMGLYICWKAIEGLKMATTEYIEELQHCAVVKEKKIPWKQVLRWKRLICTFMELLWQWLTTYTNVAILARGVTAWAPEVTNWAHLNKYPYWSVNQDLMERWGTSPLKELLGPFHDAQPTVRFSFSFESFLYSLL